MVRMVAEEKTKQKLPLHLHPSSYLKTPGLLFCQPTCPADIMEDAEQQGLGDATCSSHRAVQLGQSPVKLLRLLGPHRDTGLILLLSSDGIVTHTAHCIWPRTTGQD